MAQLAAYALIAVLNVVIQAPVVDQAEVLRPQDRALIEARVRALRQHTGAQLAVLTIRTTGGEPLADFSHRTASAWGGGRKGRDDGLLLTLATADRQVRLEVGYGLEAQLPDVTTHRILDATSDDLRQKQYAAAIVKVVDQLEAHLQSGRADGAGASSALGPAPPATPPPYPRVIPFRADPVPPEPLPPLGPLALAPLAGLCFGYALGSWRARARVDLVDVFAFLIPIAVAFAAFSSGTRDGRGKLLAMSLGGLGCSSMLARSWGLTRLGWLVAAAIGGLGSLGALLLQFAIYNNLTATAASFYRCLLLALASGAAAQLLAAASFTQRYHSRLWDPARARGSGGTRSRGIGSDHDGWSTGGGGGGSGGGDSGSGGGNDWGGGGGEFGGGGADIRF